MEVAVTAFTMAIALTLAFALLRCSRTLWVDEVRYKLFVTRDSLFLYAVDNNLQGHPAYKSLRELANRYIRYAEDVSFVRIASLVAVDVLLPQKEPEAFADYKKSLRSLPEAHKQKLEEYHDRIAIEVFTHLYRSSLFLRACHILSMPLFLVMGRQRPTPSPRAIELVERDAYAKCAA